MDNDKKLFRLDLSIAIEAHDANEAYEMLTRDETLQQIKDLIKQSKPNIKEMFDKNDKKVEIIN
ncbi:MAG: hypothetical protein PHH04_05850 [Thomasclavelia sp.]|nr:hypothetical protein [Thomasclavelia sp.]